MVTGRLVVNHYITTSTTMPSNIKQDANTIEHCSLFCVSHSEEENFLQHCHQAYEALWHFPYKCNLQVYLTSVPYKCSLQVYLTSVAYKCNLQIAYKCSLQV